MYDGLSHEDHQHDNFKLHHRRSLADEAAQMAFVEMEGATKFLGESTKHGLFIYERRVYVKKI